MLLRGDSESETDELNMVLKSKDDVPSYILSFHPHLGEVLPNGNLSISWFGRGGNGELLDGYIEVSPDYPVYAK